MDLDREIELRTLWKICEMFIKRQNITCAEAIYQSDNVVLNSYEFIESICEIVGYNNSDPS